jgi:membrane associated rhomboid family serine protease
MEIDFSRYKIMIFVVALSIVYLSVFYLVPNSTENMAFVPEKVIAGEWYRIFTYPFAHLSEAHLFENVISIMIVGFITTELKTEFYDFVVIYMSASFLAVLPVFLVTSFYAIGASAAIYAGFGIITQELAKFKVQAHVPLVIMAMVAFINAFTAFFACGTKCDSFLFSMKQGGAHFSGLIMGAVGFRFMNNMPIGPNYILRGVADG